MSGFKSALAALFRRTMKSSAKQAGSFGSDPLLALAPVTAKTPFRQTAERAFPCAASSSA